MNTLFFNWADYDNDVFVGGNKKPQDYTYDESRSDYFKRWYEKNRNKHIKNVKANQTSKAING